MSKLQFQLKRRPVNHSNMIKGLSPVLSRIYSARHIESLDEVKYGLDDLADIWQMKDMKRAAQRLQTAIVQKEKILIVGDFDADGATSTVLAMRALKAFGAESVEYLVPNRFQFGYGLSPRLVEVACEMQPDLIVTVDNGISSIDGVAAANAAGIDVLVTDHHLPGDVLPEAVAIVNPNQHGCEYASKNLAGVGVIFCVMVALRRVLIEDKWFEAQQLKSVNMGSFLDLVALGTVADVVPLDRNNRILVEQGLRRIRAGRASEGILAILRVAMRNHRKLVATDLGFVVGPRLNAAGRLEDMSIGIECLMARQYETAEKFARELNALNAERRQVEQEMQAQARDDIADLQLNADELPAGVCLYSEDWHQGVVGLVASRIREQVYRPVVAFARGDEGELKGSGRSVDGLHLRDVLVTVDARNPGLILKFGGHAMAAGLSIKADDLQAFYQAFADTVDEVATDESLQPIIHSDGELQGSELSLETAYQLRNCGPWGKSFEEPMFDGIFRIQERQVLKDCHLKFTLLADRSPVVEAIVFNIDPEEWPQQGEDMRIAYTLGINEYQQRERLQLFIKSQLPL